MLNCLYSHVVLGLRSCKSGACLPNVGILGSGTTCKCLKLTEILGRNQQALCGLTNSSKVGKFEPHRANNNFFRLAAKNLNIQA